MYSRFVSPLDQCINLKSYCHHISFVIDVRVSKQRKAVSCVTTTDLVEFLVKIHQHHRWRRKVRQNMKKRKGSTTEEKEKCHRRGEIAGWRRI